MKYSKKILEAIQRGINLAIDDFDDVDDIEVQKKGEVKNDVHTIDLLQYVDLGLPSGTLWAKYNLGVDISKLSKAEDWYGNYYAWGETEPKTEFNWSTYKFIDKSINNNLSKLEKYIPKDKPYLNPSNQADGLEKLQPEDDAIYLESNGLCKIPTKEHFNELLNNTIYQEINNYHGILGLNGIILEGKNGNTIFFPQNGIYDEDIPNTNGSIYLWTSNLCYDEPFKAYYMVGNFHNMRINNMRKRSTGMCLRGVYINHEIK